MPISIFKGSLYRLMEGGHKSPFCLPFFRVLVWLWLIHGVHALCPFIRQAPYRHLPPPSTTLPSSPTSGWHCIVLFLHKWPQIEERVPPACSRVCRKRPWILVAPSTRYKCKRPTRHQTLRRETKSVRKNRMKSRTNGGAIYRNVL